MAVELQVHHLINKQRKRHGSPNVRWSNQLAALARSQAKYCAKVNRLMHSNRYAFKGGENLAQGGLRFSPHSIVSCWMHSKAGHREYLLSSRVTQAGVGIARSSGKTYVAWAFSDTPVSKSFHPLNKTIKNKITSLNIIAVLSITLVLGGFLYLLTNPGSLVTAIHAIVIGAIIWINKYRITKWLKANK